MTTSTGVYRRLTGKTFVAGGALNSPRLMGRIPRLLVVVHSGNVTMGRWGYFRMRVARSTRRVPGGGLGWGAANARRMACSREICSTWRELGYEAVKMGSKIAAR